jgi:hypothetical protein
MNIADIRKKFPQYGDMSDDELVRGIHQKHYSDMDFGDFSSRVGYTMGMAQSTPVENELDKQKRMGIDFESQAPAAQPDQPVVNQPIEINSSADVPQTFGTAPAVPGVATGTQQPTATPTMPPQNLAQLPPPAGTIGDIFGTPDQWAEDYKQRGRLVARSANESLAGFMNRLDEMTSKLSELTGIDKGGLFAKARDAYLQNAEHWNQKIGANPALTDEIIGEIIGGAIPGMFEFSMGPAYSGAVGYAEGGPGEALKQAGERALMGQLLHGINKLKALPRTALSAALGGGEAAMQGGGPRDIAKGAAALGAFGATATGGEKIGMRDIIGRRNPAIELPKNMLEEPEGFDPARNDKKPVDVQGDIFEEPGIQPPIVRPPADVAKQEVKIDDVLDQSHDAGRSGLPMPDPDALAGRKLNRLEHTEFTNAYEAGKAVQEAINAGRIREGQGQPVGEVPQRGNEPGGGPEESQANRGNQLLETPSRSGEQGGIVPAISFKNTNEAVAYGEKATPEQMTELQRLETEARSKEAEYRKAKDFSDERTNNAFQAQLYREAIEASRGEHPSQRDTRTAEQTLKKPSAEAYEPSQVQPRPTPAVPSKPGPQEIAKERRHSAIIKKMEDAFNAPVRVGKFRRMGGRRLGIYKTGEKVIRVGSANDIQTIFHENAHHIQDILGWTERHKFPDEVRNMAYAGAKNLDREGFAEFVRAYVTDEQKARKDAPQFYNEFEEKLADKPDFQDVIIEARQAYNDFKAAPSVSKVGSFIVRGDDQSKRHFPTMGQIYTELKDSLHPVRKVVEIARRQGGNIKFHDDPYIVARLLRGWARKAEQYVQHRPFQYDEAAKNGVRFEGKGLTEILAPIELAGKTKLLDTYLVAKRAVSDGRVQKGFDRILSLDDFKQTVKELEPEFKDVAKQLYDYNNQLLDYLVQSGRISNEAAESMRAKNLFYTPLHRLIDQETSGTQSLGRSARNVFNPIKRLKGSSRDIISPTENILRNTYAMINAAERNRLGVALMKLSKIEGMGKFIEKVPFPQRPVKLSKDDFMKIVNEYGDGTWNDFSDVPDDIIAAFRPQYRAGANEAIFYDKGKPQLFEMEPEFLKAISSASGAEVNMLIKFMSYPAKWLRAGATTFSPEFGIRNPMRDQMTAWIQTKYGFAPGVDFLRGAYHMLKADDLWQTFNTSGAAHAAIVSMDRDYLSKNLRRLMREKSSTLRRAGALVLNPLELVQKFSEITEEATRVGEFAKALKKEGGGPEGLSRAGMAGREISLDFSRTGGPSARAANMISAFWNARLEGLDKMARTFKEQPVKAAAKAFMGITLPSVLLWYHQKDDPTYQELPTWRKTLFWNFVQHREGKKPFVWSIPVPFEYGLVFGSLPTAALDWAYREDPTLFKQTASQVAKTFDLAPLPTGAIPIMEWWANKSLFFNKPIVPRDKEDLEPVMQYGPRTSETIKLLAEGMDKIPGLRELASPAKIENLIQGYTASAGRSALQGTDWLLEKVGFIDPKPEPPMELSDMPGIRAVVSRFPSANSQSIERFYDKYLDLKRSFESDKERVGIRGMGIQGTGFGKSYPKEESTAQALSMLRKMARVTYESKAIDSETKGKLLDRYYFAMINAARAYFGQDQMEVPE